MADGTSETGFWLGDALVNLGAGAATYFNNKLTIESARDELALYRTQLAGQQAQAANGQVVSVGGVNIVPIAVIGVAILLAVLVLKK